MKVIIIEDEKPAAEKLQKSLLHADQGIQVLAMLNSVQQSLAWLRSNPAPELIFMDIELSDGLSFRILNETHIECPVIFITAFDDYWQEAFEHNSIEYLLKPVKQSQLEAALGKYQKLKTYFANNFQNLLQWQAQHKSNTYKKRLLVKRGTEYVSIKTEEIAYFYASHKLVCLVDRKNQKFILDQSLADIEKQLDPSQFYRVNRKYILHVNAIRRMKTYPKSKLQVEVEPSISEEIIISQENVAAFKQWMEQ